MSNSFNITINDIDATIRLGHLLSTQISLGNIRNIFMTGPLGSGKTCLTRAIVEKLPQYNECEVASPSFSIVCYYPVQPLIQHCDLYRCQSQIPDEMLDNFENTNIVTLLEWAEFLPKIYWPTEVLALNFTLEKQKRSITLQAYGDLTQQSISWLAEKF